MAKPPKYFVIEVIYDAANEDSGVVGSDAEKRYACFLSVCVCVRASVKSVMGG